MVENPTRKMDAYGPGDFTIPEVKLVQNVGGDLAKQQDAKPGDFYLPMMGEVISGTEGLDVILVDMLKTRTYWGRADINDEPPQCSSLDAESYKSQNDDDCHTCEYFNETPWLLDPAKRREMCLVNYNLLVFRTSDLMPLLIRTGGISTAAARNLLTSFRLNRQLAGQYHRVIVHVVSQKKKTASGEAYAFVFTPNGRVSDEKLLEVYRDQSVALLGTQLTLSVGRDETADNPFPRGDFHHEAIGFIGQAPPPRPAQNSLGKDPYEEEIARVLREPATAVAGPDKTPAPIPKKPVIDVGF